MHTPLTSVRLTDTELLLLDGCRPELQPAVDAARNRVTARTRFPELTAAQAGLIADVLAEAHNEGRLVHLHRRLDHCTICGADGAMMKPKRKRTAVWVALPGVELADRFVRITGLITLGCCTTCFNTIEPFLVSALRGVPVELPESWKAAPHDFLRFQKCRCTKCDWTGHEGLMWRKRNLLNNGWYPGGCPECDATNGLGRDDVRREDGFVVVAKPWTFSERGSV